MRRIAAHYLFTGRPPLLRHGMVTLDDTQRVVEVSQWKSWETPNTEFYNGILTPGFVNAHCHLELSHLRGVIAPRTGLAGFLEAMIKRPADAPSEVELYDAEQRMRREGVMAVGDVCNTPDTFMMKRESSIYYHSFVEMSGLPESVTEARRAAVVVLMKAALEAGLMVTLTPHATYSMNEELFNLAVEVAQLEHILSLHNQESEEENALFQDGTGALHALFSAMGFTPPKVTGLASIHRLLPLLRDTTRLLLVHNTATSEADYDAVCAVTRNVSWVLCPNSNLYITGMLPPAGMFFSKGASVAIGTDSLASNSRLSVLEELKTLSFAFPQIPLETLLQWATYGGAYALRMEQELGLIEAGRRPGLALLENMDLKALKLTPETTIRNMNRI
jgi:cytosine/adenosine deaminase-related metal-dependent hydrolase